MSDSDVESQNPDRSTHNDEERIGEDVKDESGKVPKHLRLRYWNSWEEMRLIELWRRYKAEVVTLKHNLPIFRTISDGMRHTGFHVNAQECRRKINTLKNKYIAERRKLELTDAVQTESDWKLYPLIHCLLAPKCITNTDLKHEYNIVSELLAKLPTDATAAEPTAHTTHANRRPLQASNAQEQGGELVPDYGVLYDDPPPLKAGAHNTTTQQRYVSPLRNSYGIGNLLRRRFTRPYLEQLRADNQRLAAQRDNSLKRLLVEERECKLLETFLKDWHQQHEQLLQRLQCARSE